MSDEGQRSFDKGNNLSKDIKFEGEGSNGDSVSKNHTDSLKNQIKRAIGEEDRTEGRSELLAPEMNPHTPIAKPRGVRQNLFSFAIQTQHNQLPKKTQPVREEEPPRTPEPSKRNAKKAKKAAEDWKAEADKRATDEVVRLHSQSFETDALKTPKPTKNHRKATQPMKQAFGSQTIRQPGGQLVMKTP